MKKESPLNQIVRQLQLTAPIDRLTILSWMTTQDNEAAGALMSLLSDEKHFKRIHPPLTDDDCFDFITAYYERALLENPDDEWSDSRTTAGWGFAKWFLKLWDDPAVPRETLTKLKAMLERVCKKGGLETSSALVTAVMEHLFHRPEIVEYFSPWADDPQLSSAYEEARKLASLKTGINRPEAFD